MTNPNTQITPLYQEDDVQQILRLAIAKREQGGAGGEITRQQMLEIANELGISPEDLKAAEQQWLSRKGEFQEKQNFDLARRAKLKQNVTKYGIVNAFLIILNLATAHTFSWSIPILLLWGLALTLSARKTFQTEGEEYEQAFQRWRLKKQVGQSIGNIADKVIKGLQS